MLAFIDKCLAAASVRLSAWELLNDPFLQIDDYVCNLRQPYFPVPVNGYSNYICYEQEQNLGSYAVEYESTEIDLLYGNQEDEDYLKNVNITIKGKRNEDGSIFLRLRIVDKEGENLISFTKLLEYRLSIFLFLIQLLGSLRSCQKHTLPF